MLSGRDGHPTFSTDGRWLAIDSYRNELVLVDMCAVDDTLRGAALVRSAAAPPALRDVPRVAPTPLFTWQRFEPVARHFVTREDVRTDLHPRFSPDGECIIFISFFTTRKLNFSFESFSHQFDSRSPSHIKFYVHFEGRTIDVDAESAPLRRESHERWGGGSGGARVPCGRQMWAIDVAGVTRG